MCFYDYLNPCDLNYVTNVPPIRDTYQLRSCGVSVDGRERSIGDGKIKLAST